MKIAELPGALPPGPPSGFCPGPVGGLTVPSKPPAAFYDAYDVMVTFGDMDTFSFQPISPIFFS